MAALIRLTTQKVLRSQALRCTVIALIWPTLLVAPGQAGMLVLHRHSDESTHVHRLEHADPHAWHDEHAKQHHGDRPGRHDSHEPEVAVGDADCDDDTPFVVLTKDHLSRLLRSRDSGTILGQILSASAAVAALPATPDQDLTSGPPPPNIPRADLATLDATVALLLRNHALLL